MREGLTEDDVQKIHDYERSDLPDRVKLALRLADTLAGDHRSFDRAAYEELRREFTEDEILDLGMSIAFFFGWGRFIEAFGIVPDSWRDGAAPPWVGDAVHALDRGDAGDDGVAPPG